MRLFVEFGKFEREIMLHIDIKQDAISPILSNQILTILKSVIRETGMDASIITARCFCSGGASYSIERSVQPTQLMKIRKWKSANVFFNNYVALDQLKTLQIKC